MNTIIFFIILISVIIGGVFGFLFMQAQEAKWETQLYFVERAWADRYADLEETHRISTEECLDIKERYYNFFQGKG